MVLFFHEKDFCGKWYLYIPDYIYSRTLMIRQTHITDGDYTKLSICKQNQIFNDKMQYI